MDSKRLPEALSRLVVQISESYPVAALQAKLAAKRLDLLAPAAAHPVVVALLAKLRREKPLSAVQLVVVATGREAEDVAAALRNLVDDLELLEFPSWETLPHERLSPSPETVGKRLKVLTRLHELSSSDAPPTHPVIVLASVRMTAERSSLANRKPANIPTAIVAAAKPSSVQPLKSFTRSD